jgi:hypothetical protein
MPGASHLPQRSLKDVKGINIYQMLNLECYMPKN